MLVTASIAVVERLAVEVALAASAVADIIGVLEISDEL